MQIVSHGPLRTGSILWMPAAGRFTRTIIAKGTFVLKPGVVVLAKEQEDVRAQDRYWDDSKLSLHEPSDLAPFKRRADVVLVGNVFAPRGHPVRVLHARLSVGELDKTIEVLTTRAFTREGELRERPPFAKMPLRYERAGGGPGTWNPVGISPDQPPDAQGHWRLPNLQPPGLKLTSPGEGVPPVGFGPIAPSWRLRRDKLRQRADTWTEASLAHTPLDEDFDGAFFQVAPPDQQLRELPADAPILLESLHLEHPMLVTRLSGQQPKVVVERPNAPPFDLPMTADLLWIDTDRGLCTVTWRGYLSLPQPEVPWRAMVALVEPAARSSAEPSRTVADTRSGPASGPLETMSITAAQVRPSDPERSVLPFARAPYPSAPPPAPPAPVASAPRSEQPETLQGSLVSFGKQPAWMSPGLPPAEPAPSPAAMPPPPPPLAMVPAVEWPPMIPPAAPPPRLGPDKINLGEVNEEALARAALGGLFAASNAAVPAPAAAAPRPSALELEAPQRRTLLELVWFSPDEVLRIRGTPAWASLIAPPKPRKPPVKGAPPAPPDPPEAAEQAIRVDLGRILAEAAPARGAALIEAMAAGLCGGALTPSLQVVAGELEFPFDELETLKAVVGAAAPLAAADKKLKEILDVAAEMMKSDLQGATDVVDNLLARVRDAWSKANRQLPASHLEARVERLLLEQRRYQKRDLLDGAWIRALLRADGGAPLPAYLPAALAGRLPLFRSFAARAVVEVLLQQDQYESQPISLRVVALARTAGVPALPR